MDRFWPTKSKQVARTAPGRAGGTVNYGTAVPDIVKWSSVMKSTRQRLHANTLTSGSSSTPGIVRVMTIGRQQFGQSGDWESIFPTDRTRLSLLSVTPHQGDVSIRIDE
jgi:hypothetical protein